MILVFSSSGGSRADCLEERDAEICLKETRGRRIAALFGMLRREGILEGETEREIVNDASLSADASSKNKGWK